MELTKASITPKKPRLLFEIVCNFCNHHFWRAKPRFEYTQCPKCHEFDIELTGKEKVS